MKIVILKNKNYDRHLKRAAVFRAITKRTRQQKERTSHVGK